MSDLVKKTDVCHCLTECIDKTDKATDLTTTMPTFFSAKERQFLLLISSDDVMSAKASSALLTKVPVKNMLDAGLLKQNKACSNFNQLLSKNNPQTLHSQSSKIPKARIEKSELKIVIDTFRPKSNSINPIIELLSGNVNSLTA